METETKRRRLTRNRLIKACTICRKLKTKCTFMEGESICVRCQSLNLNCVPFVKGPDARAAQTLQNIYHYVPASTPPSHGNGVMPDYSPSPTGGNSSDPSNTPGSSKFPQPQVLGGLSSHVIGMTSQNESRPPQDDRINNLESKVNKILSSLQALTNSLKAEDAPSTSLPLIVPQHQRGLHNTQLPRMEPSRNYRELVNPEYLLNASSPVGLVRNIEDRLYGKRHDLTNNIRGLGDVVSHGFISESTSADLIEVFWTHYSPWVDGFLPDKNSWRNMRYKCPLLFSVCCMLASRYDKTVSIQVVKSMYDLVRQVVGLTLLNAPYFTFESLVAFYLVSLWAPTVLTEIPVDSWSMSLQTLNQCVLADQIKFSRYHARDLASLGQIGWYRLWNALVLTHVQWTIATSRPFSVPEYYISQCMQIYQFPQISLQDKLMTAEIYLYRRLIKLTWDTRVILPSDGLKIDLIEEWKTEFLEAYHSSSSLFRFKYDFAYTVIFRTYLRQESGNDREDETPGKNGTPTEQPLPPGTSTTVGSGSLSHVIGDQASELAVNGRSHRLAKECVVIALVYHALKILETFNTEASYDPRVIDVPDYDFFMVIYCGMTLCEITMLLWKKVCDKLWYGSFVCTSVEEYYERAVDKLRYCYQDETISITPSKVHETMVQTLATFKRYTFNEGHVCAQFGFILEELLRKTDEALVSSSSTSNNPATAPSPLATDQRAASHISPISGNTPMGRNNVSLPSLDAVSIHPQGITHILSPVGNIGAPSLGTTKPPPVGINDSQSHAIHQQDPKPIPPTPGSMFPWLNEGPDASAGTSTPGLDSSKFSPMDSYESFYIADDVDVFKRIFPGGLLTLDNMN